MTFAQLLQDEEFLNRMVFEINKSSEGENYVIPNQMPNLYRYSGITEYLVNNIKKSELTVTAVSEFNDMFDSGICIFSNEEELHNLIEKDLKELSELGIDISSYRDRSKEFYLKEAELKRNTVNYLGAHMSCFSTTDSSILMWAHYAKNNTGICVNYDTEGPNNIFRKWAFPVVYRKKPINVSSLLYDKNELYQYRTELAVMLSILCKCLTWSYEKEWRLISPIFPDNDKKLRYNLSNVPKIKEIIFGYHFLRNCFGKNTDESKKNIKQIVDYAKENNISLYVMLQDTGEFSVHKQKVDSDRLGCFIEREFDRKIKSNIPYTTIHRLFQREVCGLMI